MKTKILLFVLFLSIFSIIAAQNHMDIMTTMTGEYNHAHFGWIMTTLDWNGDGHDDLVVDENQWKPEEYQSDPDVIPYGKLFIYYGGNNFDNVPEKIIDGQYQGEYGHTSSICDGGDINGDGVNDLVLFRSTPFENGNDWEFNLKLSVFYGGADPDTVADYELVFPRRDWSNEICYVRGLGDINHDGYDDIGYTMDPADSYSDYHFGIIYGGQTYLQESPFLDAGSRTDFTQFCGLGDVNGDSFDDFCIGYCYNLNEINYQRIVLYFGNQTGAPYDSLVVFDGTGLIIPFAFPAGDINGDGVSDFTACYSSSGYRLYLGNPNINTNSYVEMSPSYFGDWAGWGFGHGDMNGDGYDDLLGTRVSWGSGTGSFTWWMGGTPMNGGNDLLYNAPDEAYSDMFGFCLTMGDYNADGCCDAAISAPFDYAGWDWSGKVYVYAGNTQLDDPLPVTDDIAPAIVKGIELYPNPLSTQKPVLTVNFAKQSGNDISTFEVFNVRGQKVKSLRITAEQAKSGSAAYDLHDLASGVYVCILQNGTHRWQGKITMIK